LCYSGKGNVSKIQALAILVNKPVNRPMINPSRVPTPTRTISDKISAPLLALILGFLSISHAAAAGVAAADLGTETAKGSTDRITSGDVRTELLDLSIGSMRPAIRATTIAGRGSELSVTLQPPPGEGPLLLEVEEVHNRRPETFAYSLLVDGRPVYFRTYDELAAGRNHFFVDLPEEADRESITITFRSASAAPFSISRLWLYRDFEGLAEQDGTYQPMAVAENPTWLLPEFVTKGPDGKPVKKMQAAETQARAWTAIKERMADGPYSPSVLQIISYGNMPAKDVDEDLRQALETTAAHAVDLNIAFNASEWGYSPVGPDGLGGYFSDINYSKVLFRPETGDFRPTWLNTPGNTTWPTWNHPQLIKFWNYRLSRAARSYIDQRDFLRARGATFPRPTVNQEWGFSVRDHNDATLSAAKNDGVHIDPKSEDLDEEQKRWVFDNAADAAARFGKTFDDAVGRDRIVIDKGEILLPDGQSVDDNFFQTFADAIEPYYEDQWAGWQFGASAYSWATGELLPHHPEAIYDYIRGLGKLTGPNIERLCLPTLDYYHALYERGFQQITPLNPRPGETENFLPQGEGLRERAARPPVHHDRKLLELAFRKEVESPGPDSIIARNDNVEVSTQGFGLVMAKPPQPGEIIYNVRNAEPTVGGRLIVELDARIPKDKGGKIIVMMGESPSAMSPVATFSEAEIGPVLDFTGTQIAKADLGDSFSKKPSFFLGIRLEGQYASYASIHSLRLGIDWDQRTGPTNGKMPTVRDVRTRNLWVQERAVFEKAAERYRKSAGEDQSYAEAMRLASQGLYRKAYQTIAGAEAKILPAGFALRGYGTLPDYPVSLRLDNEEDVVLVDLKSAGPDEYSLQFRSEKPVSGMLEIRNVPEQAAFEATQPEPNHYLLRRSDSGALKPTGGTVTTKFNVLPAEALNRQLPKLLTGMALSSSKEGILIETQEADLWLDNPHFIPVTSETKYSRKQHGKDGPLTTDWPKQRDRVEIVLDESGTATEVRATFGRDQGKIRSFSPPQAVGKIHNGIIELENGNRYELANMWHMTAVGDVAPLKPFVRANSNEALSAAFYPGRTVGIEFSPYTSHGRLPRMVKVTSSDPPKSGKK